MARPTAADPARQLERVRALVDRNIARLRSRQRELEQDPAAALGHVASIGGRLRALHEVRMWLDHPLPPGPATGDDDGGPGPAVR